MKNELIGVIVPVYKTEKYIAECIESILAQTYTNFRLILVDDGTPDNAGAICDEYALKDNRITVIHQENAGVTRARARGVEEAHDCEWITFVDSDDTITPDAVSNLIAATKNNKCDIIVSPISVFVSNKKISLITIDEFRHRIITEELCSPCGKLYRRSIFNSKTFSTPRSIVIGEDLIMNLHLSFASQNNVAVIPNKIYVYNYIANSTINTFNPTLEYEEKLYDYIVKVVEKYQTNIKRVSHALIKRRLLWWDRLFGYNDSQPAWYGSDYHRQLFNDIQKYKYPLGTVEKFLLNEKRPYIRKILIFVRKIKNIFRHHFSK